MTTLSVKAMLECGAHFGHKKRYVNPKMYDYIHMTTSSGVHIINLVDTLSATKTLLSSAAALVENRGKILFVGTKFAASQVIKEEAVRCGMPYVDYRWLGGMLTNYKTIRQSIVRLGEYESQLANPRELEQMTKKERLALQRKYDKLCLAISGIKHMGGLPDMLFVVDVNHEKIAIKEANRLGIKVAALVDTNASPEGIDIVVPANDDSVSAIRYFTQLLAEQVIVARAPLVAAEEKAAAEKSQKVVVKKSVKRTTADGDTADAAAPQETAPKASDQPKKVVIDAQTSLDDVENPAVATAGSEQPEDNKE